MARRCAPIVTLATPNARSQTASFNADMIYRKAHPAATMITSDTQTPPPSHAPAPGVQDGVLWNYSPGIYLLRGCWAVVSATIWPLGLARLLVWRPLLLRLFGAKTPAKVLIAGSARVEFPWELTIGQHVSIGPRTRLYNLGGLHIGDQSVLSQDVYVCGGTHDYTDPTLPLVRRKIQIGRQVWIAAGAFIGPGVTVGDGAVIGARAVVVRDVPAWTVVAGNPARIVKQRTDPNAATPET